MGFKEMGKRKFPRRKFYRAVGCLCQGRYHVGAGTEIGEGGIAIAMPESLPMNQEVVLNFQVPSGGFVSVRAEIVNTFKSKSSGDFVYGCAFKNLKFENKREIRFYVSARSELEN